MCWLQSVSFRQRLVCAYIPDWTCMCELSSNIESNNSLFCNELEKEWKKNNPNRTRPLEMLFRPKASLSIFTQIKSDVQHTSYTNHEINIHQKSIINGTLHSLSALDHIQIRIEKHKSWILLQDYCCLCRCFGSSFDFMRVRIFNEIPGEFWCARCFLYFFIQFIIIQMKRCWAKEWLLW